MLTHDSINEALIERKTGMNINITSKELTDIVFALIDRQAQSRDNDLLEVIREATGQIQDAIVRRPLPEASAHTPE